MALNTCLTVGLVEELQQLASLGKSVAPIVQALQSASLPGIMEYGSFRSSVPSVPELPPAVWSSSVGKALQLVRSKMELRTIGTQREPPRNMTPCEHEFFVLEGDDPQESQPWKEYLLRFRQSSVLVGFEMKKATGLAAALHEMADNAVNHAEADDGILVGYHVVQGVAVSCIVDAGIGVLASLLKCPSYGHLKTHREAIRWALKKGVTRFGPGQGGNGFDWVFKSLTASFGTLRFRSGEGCVTMDGRDLESDRGEEAYVLPRPGFQVTICCRLSGSPDSVPLV